MFKKARVVIFCLLVAPQIRWTCAQMLPTSSTDNYDNSTKPATTYYRHNIFGPNTYAYGYEVNDRRSGNIQFRDERRYGNGTIEGSYGYVRPDGRIMVTHFLADRYLGYLSQTQTFKPGDEPKWQQHWSTKKENILKEKPLESTQPTIDSDEKKNLNLTSIILPVQPINEKYGINLNSQQLEKELVNPVVLEAINGEVPVITDTKKINKTLDFETVNNFIPPEFPIVPFRVPQNDDKMNLNDIFETKPIPVLKAINNGSLANKYDNQKIKKSEKIPNLSNIDPLSNDNVAKYQKNNANQTLPIKALRQEYLETVP